MWVRRFYRRTNSRQVIATCNSIKLRRKLLAESDLTLEKVLQIGQLMEEAQHHLSIIEQKSTLPISETLNQEELNALITIVVHHQRNHFKKVIWNKIKSSTIESHIIRIRNNIVTTKMNAVTVVPKDTEEINVDKVEAEHVVNAVT